VPGGIKLLPSPPPVKRLSVRVPARAALPSLANTPVGAGRRIQLTPEALEAAKRLAPRWDIHVLEAMFWQWVESLNEPLRLPPDKAFIGWVKSFTKGKAPT
jgi:hypothetical protein